MMALGDSDNACEELAVYEEPNSADPLPYETPVSETQYEIVLNHTTVVAIEAADHHKVDRFPVYERVGPGGSSNLFYQYVPSKVSDCNGCMHCVER